jgi:acetolactate synthase-1/2/3 large subunit
MKQIADGNLVPSTVREAFRVVEEKGLGAMHLELPKDITSVMINAQPFLVYLVRRPIVKRKAIAKPIDLIHASSHPLLLIGARANHQQTQ